MVHKAQGGHLPCFLQGMRPLLAALALSLLLALVVKILLLAGAAQASEAPQAGRFSGDASRGQAFAEQACAGCHAVGTSGSSPLKQAPAFRHLARRYPVESLAEALAEGIVTAHPDMPEVVLEPDAIEDFLTYLQRIQLP